MATKAPPLEETKALLLKELGADGLKKAEAQFAKNYGNSVKEPATKYWLMAKQAGLDVEDIQATSDGGEGDEKMIAEVQNLAKDPEAHGWTLFDFSDGGSGIQQPEDQAKYSIRCVVLSTEEGVTSKGGPKMDLLIADATGIAKMVAYADAVANLTEAHVKAGSVVHFPLVNCQYGRHNFGKTKNAVWWKFALPPFGDVRPLEIDPKEFFLNLEQDVVKDSKPCYTTGFITFVNPRLVEVCNVCDRWVLERRPQDHDKCRKECKQKDEEWGSHERTEYEGTFTSVKGETRKLNLTKKPKVQLCVDLVEVYGHLTARQSIQVAFIRKASGTAVAEDEEPEAEPAPVAKPAKKAAPKAVVEEDAGEEDEAPPAKPVKKAKPTPVQASEEEEEEQEPEAEEEPAPPPKPKPAAKKPAKAAPVVETEDEEPPEEPEETEEEDEEPTVVVKAATKTPIAGKAPAASKASAKGGQVTVQEVPVAIVEHVEKMCKQFGGGCRVFNLNRAAIGNALQGFDGLDEDEGREKMEAYLSQIAESGRCTFNPATGVVKWIG